MSFVTSPVIDKLPAPVIAFWIAPPVKVRLPAFVTVPPEAISLSAAVVKAAPLAISILF